MWENSGYAKWLGYRKCDNWMLLCSLEKKKTQNAAVCYVFQPFNKFVSKKNAISSVGSFQKCTCSLCTQECPHCLTVNTGPSLSEVWFLLLSSLCWSWSSWLPFLLSSFLCTLTLCPLPWHGLCGCLFCMLVEFATVVMVVGKEINKKAGNGKQIDKSRGGVKGKGKRQRVTVSYLTSADKVIGNLSFHYWRRRFEGKGIAFFFLMDELVKMGRNRTNFWTQTPFFRFLPDEFAQ